MKTYKNVVDIDDLTTYAIKNFDHLKLADNPEFKMDIVIDKDYIEDTISEIFETFFTNECLSIYLMDLKYVTIDEVEVEINSEYCDDDDYHDVINKNFHLILKSFMNDNRIKYLYIIIEHTLNEEPDDNIYLKDPREFNYYFEIGDKVMVDSARWSFEYKPGEHLATHLGPYIGMVGEVMECKSDFHAFGQGSTYWCNVKFGDEIITQMCSEFIKVAETEG